MTIDAVLVAMFNLLPYKINLESQDKDLEELYSFISNTTEPILSLDIVKKNFDISNYEVHTHNHQLQAIVDDIPDHIQKMFENENKILKALNGKRCITLDKDNIKDIFSVEKWRDKQLNKLI